MKRGYTMSNERTLVNTRIKLLAGAVILGAAGMGAVASAQSTDTLVGGGATLPAIGYVNDVADHKQVNPPTDGSLFYAWSNESGASNPMTSYCQSGSGTGKNVLAGVSGNNVQNSCPDTGAITGFGAPAADRSDLAWPNFAAADSPLAQSDYDNYIAAHTSSGSSTPSSYPVQFPSAAGSISIVFKKLEPDHMTPLPSLNLTEAQVCRIFSGQITQWDDPQLASALPPGVLVSGPINVVFRSDGSGTSFAFSNHLTETCGTIAPISGVAALNIAGGFVTSQDFSAAVAAYLPSYASHASFQGNQGVVTNLTDGSIGYAETANAKGAAVGFADVSRVGATSIYIDPTSFGGSVLPVSVAYNEVITGADPETGRPTVDTLTTPPSTSCIALVNPDNYAYPASGYPIIAVSYLLGNSNGNGMGDLANTKGLLSAPYDTSLRSVVSTMGLSGTGLAFVSNADFTPTRGAPHLSPKVDSCLVD